MRQGPSLVTLFNLSDFLRSPIAKYSDHRNWRAQFGAS